MVSLILYICGYCFHKEIIFISYKLLLCQTAYTEKYLTRQIVKNVLIIPYGVSFIIILLSISVLAFLASSGDSVTSAVVWEVGEISNWIEQSFPVQPLSQKHWFKFEQICGQSTLHVFKQP